MPFETNLTSVIIGLVFHGMGIAFLLVSTFTDALRTSILNGFEDGIETYGLISGLWTSVFAFGAFIGPSISGYLFDHAGFRTSVYFIIIVHSIVAVIFIFFTCCSSAPRKLYKELSSEEKLIGKSTTSLNSRQSTGSITSLNIPVPITMNNMVIASSYGKNHWQRMEESNLGLLSDIRDENYGAITWSDDPHRETIA